MTGFINSFFDWYFCLFLLFNVRKDNFCKCLLVHMYAYIFGLLGPILTSAIICYTFSHLKFLLNCKLFWWCMLSHLCPTLCYPLDYNLPVSSAHGIFQAKKSGVDCYFPTPGDLPDPGIEAASPISQQLLYYLSKLVQISSSRI